PKFFESVEDVAGSAFFQRNGLLFQPTAKVGQQTQGLAKAAPLIGTLVGDQSLRGLTRAMSLALIGVQSHQVTLDAMKQPLTMAAATIEDTLAGRRAVFSWQEVRHGGPPSQEDLRHFIEVRPVL